jgi:hypothetical protein
MSQFERLHQVSPEACLNNYFQLCYGNNFEKKLNPLVPIPDESLSLSIIENNTLKVQRLLLMKKDHTPILVQVPATGDILRLEYPGKSARLNLSNENLNKGWLSNVINQEFNTSPDRRDHLHTATIQDIHNAGYLVFWAPLQIESLPFHVRIISKKTILGQDITIDDATKLAQCFTRRV